MKSRSSIAVGFVAVLLAASLVLAGCGGGGGSSTSSGAPAPATGGGGSSVSAPSTGSGSITVADDGTLTAGVTGGGAGASGGSGTSGGAGTSGTIDLSGYARIVICVRQVLAVPAGQEDRDTDSPPSNHAPSTPGLPVIATFDPPVPIDILTLTLRPYVLGKTRVPSGTYSQFRVVLEPNVSGQPPVNYVTLESDPATRFPLRTPSGQQSGLKIVGRFQVSPHGSSQVLFDLDPTRAIIYTGNEEYLLKPTGIRLVEITSIPSTLGGLRGTVAPPSAWNTARVSAVDGTGETVATSAVDPADGSFRLPLPPGAYALNVTATGFKPLSTSLTTFAVVAGVDTDVGTVTLKP